MKKLIILAGIIAAIVVFTLGARAAQVTGLVNVNTASVTELNELPGIGETKSHAIVEHRQQKPFVKKEELLLVKGIGDKLFAKIASYVSVQGATTIHPQKSVTIKPVVNP